MATTRASCPSRPSRAPSTAVASYPAAAATLLGAMSVNGRWVGTTWAQEDVKGWWDCASLFFAPRELRLAHKRRTSMLIPTVCGDPRHPAALGSSSTATVAAIERLVDSIFPLGYLGPRRPMRPSLAAALSGAELAVSRHGSAQEGG